MGSGQEGVDITPETPNIRRERAPTKEELHKRFHYHPPRDEIAIGHHAAVSAWCYELALRLCEICPPGRNLSLALTALEEVRMRGNAAIACDDPRP